MDEQCRKIYDQWKREIWRHEEHKMALLDQIEKLQLKLWKYDEESHKREEYLVGKIERLEDELREKEALLRSVDNSKTEERIAV